MTSSSYQSRARVFLFSLALFFFSIAIILSSVEAQGTESEFTFFGNTEANADESERTKEIQATCVQPPAQTDEELAAQQALYESQLQDYFFQFLPCALGGSQNLECCQNLDAILGPYPTADLHNCLCLPGAFDALVEGSQGIGNQNITEIFYGCAARDDIEFNTLFLGRCTPDNVIIPEGYDLQDILSELGDVAFVPEEALDEITQQINLIIDSFRPPSPPTAEDGN